MAFRITRPKTFVRLACLLAALGGGEARAAQVYPGCPVPDAAPRHVFTIDAVNGDVAGDGSKAHPWKSLQAVFASIDGASPLLSTVPYHHRSPVDQKFVMTPNTDAPMHEEPMTECGLRPSGCNRFSSSNSVAPGRHTTCRPLSRR